MSENNTTNRYQLPAEQKSGTVEKADRKVIQGTARTKQKSELQKAAGSFVSSDIRSVGSYALTDIIIPALKNTIVSVIKNGAEKLFFGEVGRSNSSDRRVQGAYYDYSGRFDQPRDTPRREESREYDDIVFNTAEQAEQVVDAMGDCIARYGFVTVMDLFEFSGLTPPAYTKTRYGWDSIRHAEIRRTRDGDYYIDLPRPKPRDR